MNEHDFDRLGRELAREQDRLRAANGERAAARESWLIAEAPLRPAPARWLWAAVALGLCAAGAVAATMAVDPARAPLRAVAVRTGQSLQAGAFIAADAETALPLRFSDGSQFTLEPGARARLAALDEDGAHLLLEGGRAQVAVVPRAHTRFRISAGPFAVHVKGTRFAVAWDAEQDRFELDLEHGAVEVSGCVLGQGYAMRAGQRVAASCKRRQFDVAESGAERARGPVPATAPAAVPATGTGTDSDLKSRRSSGPRVRPGRAAPSHDLTSAEQLIALADAARRSGDFDDEAHALRVLRRRFAGTGRGALAAFALGRLEFDVYGDHRAAASWFATYVREQPEGPLVREARGRMLEAKVLLGDDAAARKVADAYLRDYAEGPHADLARRLLAP